jgi:hypothetical protein
MGCNDVRGEIDNVTQAALTGGAAWTIGDGQLRISGDGVELVYRQRDVLFPDRNATALLEGERWEGIWRLSWQTTGEQVGVDWESRERPGTGFDFSMIGRPVDFDVTHLEPSFASLAGEAFVFVVVPPGTERVEFRPAWWWRAGEPDRLRRPASEDMEPVRMLRRFALEGRCPGVL